MMPLVKSRWQRRKQKDGRSPYILAESGEGSFTMRVSGAFNEALTTIAGKWGDDWSKAEIIRELVYREAGVPREVIPHDTNVGQPVTKAAYRNAEGEWGGPKQQAPTKGPDGKLWYPGLPQEVLREKYAAEICERIERLTGEYLRRWNNLVQHWKNNVPEAIVIKYLDSVKEEQ